MNKNPLPAQPFTWVLAETEHCNKCGFCLPACPTYRISGQELHSPRGRIAMVEAAAREELPDLSGMEEALEFCVGCRACEPACPSGVHYERILEAGRTYLIRRGSTAFRGALASRSALYLTKHPKALRQIGRLGRRLSRIVPDVGIGSDFLGMLPKTRDTSAIRPVNTNLPATPMSPRVAFFSGCVMDSMFADENLAARNLLEAAGYSVEVVLGQSCCGAIHLHSGEIESTKALAKANIVAFEREHWAWIANAAGGCGAMLQEYPELLADESDWVQRAEAFSSRVRDFSTLLLEPTASPLAFRGNGSRIVLQNSCHLANVQRAGQDPIRLLRQVEGDTLVSFQDQEMCCGSGGLYNINHRTWAQAILDDKMGKVAVKTPDRILVNNPGCQLQMQSGVSRHQEVRASVEHVATYLWRCHLAARSSQSRRDA